MVYDRQASLSPDGPDEYPTEEDLPNDPVTVDDNDPFDVDDGFEDVDDFAAEEWRKGTTADDRILTVINRMATPKSAGIIADSALVSETLCSDSINLGMTV